MIISISGAQGQGKSTVLDTLKTNGHTVIPNKTARSILAEWDMTLEYVYSDKKLAMLFHDKIIQRHNEVCSPHYDSDEIVFIERSYADIFAYAVSVLGPFNTSSEWLNTFYNQCTALQSNMSAAVYLTGRNYIPSSDGIRSTNQHFSKAVDSLIKTYLTEFSLETKTHIVHNVNTPVHDERIAAIEDIVKIYFKED